MAYNKYDREGQPPDTEGTVAQRHRGYVVESFAKHSSGKSESVKAQITEYVAQQTGHGIIRFPQA